MTAIGLVLYPDLTQLDLTGPAEVLARLPGAQLHFVAADRQPVRSDCGLALLPSVIFADCPPLDILLVPGGPGCNAAMQDAALLGWLRARAATAKVIASVCTGSLILGAAGLLSGYRAATHWASRDLLPAFGAEPVAERVVVDRDRMTGGGVTAGIDLAFRMIEELAGRDAAEAAQLGLEYDPAPLGHGTPETARLEVLAVARATLAPVLARRRAIVAELAA